MNYDLQSLSHGDLHWTDSFPPAFKAVRLPGSSIATSVGEFGSVCIQEFNTETRHSGDFLRKAMNFMNDLTSPNGWTAGRFYGVADEISAYRAEYSFKGRLKYSSYFEVPQIGPDQANRIPQILSDLKNANTHTIISITGINAQAINSMADVRGIIVEYTYPKHRIYPEEWMHN